MQDWYPPKLPAGARLRWYAEHFNYVEVNATFYAIPNVRTVDRWCLETPDNFLFDVKLPKVLSRHAMQAKFLPPDLRSKLKLNGPNVALDSVTEELVVKRLLYELNPLFQAGKFGAFLLQLSPSFRPRTNRLEELDSLRERIAPHSMAVELRNRDWVTPDRLEETLEYFRSRKLTFVLVDAPESEHFTVMPGMLSVTNPKLGYFRYHGRNEAGYIKGRSVAERFDYDYSDEEVEELVQRAREVSVQVDELHLVANNNRSNYAPKFAAALQKGLGQTAARDTNRERQASLFQR